MLPLAPRRRADLGVLARRARARAWRSTCSTTTGRPVRGEVGELVCTKPWPGMTRGLYRDPGALPRHVLVALARRLVARRLRERVRRRAVVPPRPLRRHDQARGQATRARPRSRPPSSRTRRVVEAAAVGVPDDAEGRSALGVRGARAGRRLPTTACARRSRGASPTRSARRSSRPRSGSPARCRRRAARRCCAARFARSSPATRPATCRASRTPRRSTRSRRVREAGMSELTGARVVLRPLQPEDWDAWREVRLRCRDWLERWEPVPEPGSADPALDHEAFRARCAAWERQRHFDAAYGFGLFLLDGRFAGRGQPRQRAARSVPDGLHRLLDRREVQRQRLRPRRRRAADPVRVRVAAVCTGSKRRSCRATRRAGGLPRSSVCATRERPNASCRSRASTRTTSATRSPREEWRERGPALAAQFLETRRRRTRPRVSRLSLRGGSSAGDCPPSTPSAAAGGRYGRRSARRTAAPGAARRRRPRRPSRRGPCGAARRRSS